MARTAAFSRGIGLGIFAASLLVIPVHAEVPRKSDLSETASVKDLLAHAVYELDTVSVTANRLLQGQGFTLLDLDFTVPLGGATRLGIGIANLTNAPYREAFTSFNAPGTQIFSSLVTEF